MSSTGTRRDPATAFRFTVTFDDLPPGGFSDCTGLSLETEVLEYLEGGLNTHTWRLPGRTKQTNVTLKRGIVSKVLWDWHQAIANGDFRSRDCTIRVQDPSGSDDLIEFTLVDAFPVKWIGPELSAGANTLAIETLELAHQGLKRGK
jgi:phage tail-like protein